MRYQPKYRVRIEVYDDETGETVCGETSYLREREEDQVEQLATVLRHFKEKCLAKYEETFYPPEMRTDNET